ncbi:MAG: hypothetical protein FWC69_01945 [Defluviitaleaceae bacterium]|nr:hypothetical protein [Defluviitaleaceae bacterium]
MKRVRILSIIFTLLMLSSCGQAAQLNNPAPITYIGSTLEEQFANGASTVISVIPYPNHLPTAGISFTTPNRFSTFFEITIQVESPTLALESLGYLGGEKSDMGITSTNDGFIAQATLHLQHENLEAAFKSLYAIGIVKEYRATTWDANAIGDDDFLEYIWSKNNTIIVTFVELEH